MERREGPPMNEEETDLVRTGELSTARFKYHLRTNSSITQIHSAYGYDEAYKHYTSTSLFQERKQRFEDELKSRGIN